MGWLIHRRNTEDGPRYRLWSTSVDAYITEELTRDEAFDFLLTDYVEKATRDIRQRLERADERGTSSLLGDTRDMDAPWCGEGADEGEDDDDH